MDKLTITVLLLACLACASSSHLSLHDYDVQIHPIHGHHGYHDGGYATSIRYDKRYHHKIPHRHHDLVYQFVADEHHDHDDEDFHGLFGY